MTSELKSAGEYAALAEKHIENSTLSGYGTPVRDREVARAQVYATLALAAVQAGSR